MGARFSDEYWDREYGDESGDVYRDAIADIVERYSPSDFGDAEQEWAEILIETGEFDAFFDWMDFTYDDIVDFWEDFREMYGVAG